MYFRFYASRPGVLRPRGPCGLEAKSFGLSLGLTLSGFGLDLGLPASAWPRPHRNWPRGLEYLQCT